MLNVRLWLSITKISSIIATQSNIVEPELNRSIRVIRRKSVQCCASPLKLLLAAELYKFRLPLLTESAKLENVIRSKRQQQ